MAKPKRGRSGAIDGHVGERIRERRIVLGLSQQQLAELIGVTYQQAQKYERGINRVSPGRLFEIGATERSTPSRIARRTARRSAVVDGWRPGVVRRTAPMRRAALIGRLRRQRTAR